MVYDGDRKYLKWKLLAGEKTLEEQKEPEPVIEKVEEPVEPPVVQEEQDAEIIEETPCVDVTNSEEDSSDEQPSDDEDVSDEQPDEEDVPFKCPKCNKPYKDEYWYKKHIEKDECEEE